MTNAPRELHPVPSEGTLDIREFMSKVGRHKWLILLVAASVTLLVAIYSYSRPSVYKSTAQFLVRPTLVQPLQSNPFDTVSMPTEMQLVTSAQVADIARGTIGGNLTLQDALDSVSVTNPANTQILDISYSAHSPAEAQQGAQAFADAYHDVQACIRRSAPSSRTRHDPRRRSTTSTARSRSSTRRWRQLDPNSPEHLSLAERRNNFDSTRLTPAEPAQRNWPRSAPTPGRWSRMRSGRPHRSARSTRWTWRSGSSSA